MARSGCANSWGSRRFGDNDSCPMTSRMTRTTLRSRTNESSVSAIRWRSNSQANFCQATSMSSSCWRKALSDRCPEFFAGFPADQMAKDLRNVWRQPTRGIYRNWLLYIASQRAGRSRPLDLSGTCRVSRPAPRWPERAAVAIVRPATMANRRREKGLFSQPEFGLISTDASRSPLNPEGPAPDDDRDPLAGILARQPDEEARPDPTTEFGP
jgi:hypothetical protein